MFKRLAVVLVVCASFMLSGCDNGSMFNGNERSPEHGYQLSSAGWDLRVYEFTSLSDPSMTCVFVAGKGKGGLDCFKKSE